MPTLSRQGRCWSIHGLQQAARTLRPSQNRLGLVLPQNDNLAQLPHPPSLLWTVFEVGWRTQSLNSSGLARVAVDFSARIVTKSGRVTLDCCVECTTLGGHVHPQDDTEVQGASVHQLSVGSLRADIQGAPAEGGLFARRLERAASRGVASAGPSSRRRPAATAQSVCGGAGKRTSNRLSAKFASARRRRSFAPADAAALLPRTSSPSTLTASKWSVRERRGRCM